MPLHIRYRPRNLEEFSGNSVTTQAIHDDFTRERPPKTALISGPAGCGKTSLAYIIRDMLGCTPSGFHEFDASTDRGIDKIRTIKEESQLLPMTGSILVLFFDECHQITGPAQEAMLKLLENPPSHVYLLLATTEPHKLKESIIRRCSQYAVDRLSRIEMIKLLEAVTIAENRTWMSKKVLSKIYKVSWGSPGQAVKLLGQIIDMDSNKLAIEAIENVTYDEAMVIDLCRTLSSKKYTWDEKWDKIRGLLAAFKGNAESARMAILSYFEKELLDKPSTTVSNIMSLFTDSVMFTGRPGLTLAAWIACNDFRKIEDVRKKQQEESLKKNTRR
jgi:DNA polymerase III gamma/tau subunit